ncbi:MAG: hypothetical protein K8I30_19210, partial [Anaerolineae bacterium]|nr:hypothetical protein [Anaerolineae bacterium]
IYYNPSQHITQVWTFTAAQGWVQRSSDIPLTLQPGDQLGGRARADGFVEIYRNGNLLGTADVRAWPYFANTGYIGLWMESSYTTMLDNFGGGNSTGGVLPTPKPSNTPTPTNTPTYTYTPTSTYTPSPTPTATHTPVVPATATATLTPTLTFTLTLTFTPTFTYTPSPTATATSAAGGSFPRTVLLDNFNWTNGALPGSWTGATGGFAINNGLMDVINDGAVFWNTRFGANQEVFITLNTIDAGSEEIDLLLKSQANNTPDAGLLEVWYSPAAGRAQVWTYAPGQGWMQHGADISISLQPGDRFGARVRADGFVEVYKNESLVGTRDARGWTFATGTGFVGVWVINSRNSFFDDFGGGNVP